MDFERIMLLLAVIKKAADCGMSHAPFVSEAHKELDAIGQLIKDSVPEPPTLTSGPAPEDHTVQTQNPTLSQTMEEPSDV
jgi:hypothetical protein